MKIIECPARTEWASLLARPAQNSAALEEAVGRIMREVKEKGDAAVDAFSLEFDQVRPETRFVPDDEWSAAEKELSGPLKSAIRMAWKNIRAFHEKQLVQEAIVETMPGIRCWRKSVPIEKVGLYVPGGSAPLFSTVLMLAAPAVIAGCRDIQLCSPPDKSGKLHPAILFAAAVAGLRNIIKVGGVQAIAAMAYGTETISRVDKIFGPGNRYVTCAKQLLQREGVAIDMPAGPSELAVYADKTARAAFVAADLLSQCEHGPDSQVMLVTNDRTLASRVADEIGRQLERLPRKDIARKSLEHSKTIIVGDAETAMALLNAYAPEHLILACDEPAALLSSVSNAGSVFIGHYAPETAGDYASGTNHTLPTNGFARAYSGVSVDSFIKKISFQEITPEGLAGIAPALLEMARAEGLEAHAAAVEIRLSNP